MSTVIEPGQRQRDDSLPGDVVLYEMVDGKLVDKDVSAYAAWITALLADRLRPFVREKGLGLALVEAVFILDSERRLRRRPDLAFISADKWPVGQPPPPTGDWDLIPDLAVEITSPNDTMAGVMRKVREYFRYGVAEVWLVIPEGQAVQVYRSIREQRTYGVGDNITSELLPGWSMPVAELLPHEIEVEIDEN